MSQLRHHSLRACSQPSVRGGMTTSGWQTGVGVGPHLTVTAAHSAKQDMCQVTLYSKTCHTNSCQT